MSIQSRRIAAGDLGHQGGVIPFTEQVKPVIARGPVATQSQPEGGPCQGRGRGDAGGLC